MENIIKGIVASKGIAIGKAYLYEKTKVNIDRKKIDDSQTSAHIDAFNNAIESYQIDLEHTSENNSEAKDIALAHIELITDPFLSESVSDKIENGKMTSDWALEETINEMVQMMEMLDDDYMKERAADYKDIGQMLQYKLHGIKPKDLSTLEDKYIIIAEELTPSDTSTMKKENVLGFANDLGGKTSHTSIIAQTLSIPAIVGMKDVSKRVEHGQEIILDSIEGRVILDPSPEEIEKYRELQIELEQEEERLLSLLNRENVTKDGKDIELVGNIGNLEDLDIAIGRGAEGVGLFRTEFLYMESKEFPKEEVQFQVYKEAAEKLEGKPLIIRTLDIGGDKALDYFDFPKEENPFLGWRALRISFDLEDVFRDQLRAILRASHYGNVKILLPMIISVEEIVEVNRLLEKYKNELDDESIKYDPSIEVGIMIETPASIMIAEDLIKHCDFFSIGTNDLTQYLLAVDRGNDKISDMYNNFHPAVLRAIKRVIDVSHDANKWTGMCGSMASDPKATYLLLGMGLDEFSVVGPQIPKVKDTIINSEFSSAEKFADKILKLSTLEEINEVISSERVNE